MQGGVRQDLRLKESSRAGTWHGLSVRVWGGAPARSPAAVPGGCWMCISATHLKPKPARGEAVQQVCVMAVSSDSLGRRSHWGLRLARHDLFKNGR